MSLYNSCERLTGWIKEIASHDSFYDIGGDPDHLPAFKYAEDSVMETVLAERMTLIDSTDKSEVQLLMENISEGRVVLPKSHIKADMRTALCVEPKSAVFIKGALCWFDTDQAFKNILSMTKPGGLILLWDARSITRKFLQFCRGLKVIDEHTYPYCSVCGERTQMDCHVIGDCGHWDHYSYVVAMKEAPNA